jgi:hypothetical protein
VWIGQNNFLARWDGTAWQFSAPHTNESHLVEDVGETWHWNGTNWVKVAVAQAAATSAGELYQVGSIQQSLLNETQWASVLGPEAVKWVLADGRNVAGSRYATVTGQTNVPDLRGAFIRAAGQNSNNGPNWNGGAVGAFHEDTTRAPRNTAFTLDRQGDHYHRSGVPAWNDPKAYINGRDVISGGKSVSGFGVGSATAEPRTNIAGAHTHTVTIDGGGDTETAPDHVRIVWGIKARFATVVPASALLVHTTTPKTGDVLTYDGTTSTWKNKAIRKNLTRQISVVCE